MTFKGLKLSDQVAGKPKQAVPIRLIPFMLGVSPEEAISLLTKQSDVGHLLKGYEHAGGHKRRIFSTNQAKQLLENMKSQASLISKIQTIPEKLFSWSDEIAGAYSEYITITIGRDAAYEEGLGIIWNPALLNCDSIIDQCPDLRHLGDFQKTAKQQARDDRASQIVTEAVRLLDKGCDPRDIPSMIENSGNFINPGTGESLSRRQLTRILDDHKDK